MSSAPFPFYNLFIGIGLIIGVLTLERDFRRRCGYKKFPSFLITLTFSFLFGWFFGHFADYIQRGCLHFNQPLSEHHLYGYTFYGGFIGGALFMIIALGIQRFNISLCADIIAPIIPLVHGFGRIGCFLAGCCYGKIVTIGTLTFRFPTQITSAVFLLTLFLFLHNRKYRINRIYVYLWVYSVGRFIIEIFRGDPRGHLFITSLSPAQELSIYVLMFSLVVFFLKRLKVSDKERFLRNNLTN
ncbi:MAG: prolipoprotein diacylglyceryl transferase [candidate division Zixibacteria bacterium]|nr:prolipoprotein diacylglyceryl transferase [Candidatus Tariuqbacter arcticus]